MRERSDWHPVRGTRDVLPPEQAKLQTTQRLLDGCLAEWGYLMIDLPLLERRELYLRKAGEELVGKLYDFVHHGRALALRPEWTVSVLRAYLRALRSEPLPLRLRYTGPVMRYERPQRGTYRQFTEVGVELIGGAAPRADAEVLALASSGLEAAGVEQWTVRVGHVGVARTLLGSLGLAERTAGQLLWSMERLRREGAEGVRAELHAAETPELFDLGPLQHLPDDQLQTLLLTMLRAVGMPLANTTRDPEAIVARLVRKLRRGDTQPAIERAMTMLAQLGAAKGAPAEALAAARRLLDSEGLSCAPLDELQAILELTQAHGVPAERIVVDLGMTRGLHYYTGMIFEIEGADGLQLCGGGRYDDLIATLGSGPATPAVGFAYGLERVTAATNAIPPEELAPLVLVMADDERYPAAVTVAGELRNHGYRVLLDVRGRTLQANLRDAAKRQARAVVVIDGDDTIIWHDLNDGPRQGRLAEVVPGL